jgi:hypothetical protein
LISRWTKIAAIGAIASLLIGVSWSRAYDYYLHWRTGFKGIIDHALPIPVRVFLTGFALSSAIFVVFVGWDIFRWINRARTR